MESQMVITVISPANPDLIGRLIQIIHEHNSRICNSYMSSFGQDYGWQMLIAGTWDSLAKLETDLPILGKQHDMLIQFKRTQTMHHRGEHCRYSAQIIAAEKPGIMTNFFQFLTREKLGLEEFYTDQYRSFGFDTIMFSFNAVIYVPVHESIAQLRERFLIFCDQHNYDGAIEPLKA